MAACGSIQHIFENPLPENPTLLESLSSWNQVKPGIKSSIEQPSFTEIFGELHFKENNISQSSSSTSTTSSFAISPLSSSSTSIKGLNQKPQNSTFEVSWNGADFHGNDENNTSSSPPEYKIVKYTSNCQKKSESFPLKSESLQLCTEGLGFESFDDVEDMKTEMKGDWQSKENKSATGFDTTKESLYSELRKSSRTSSNSSSSSGAFPPPISCIGKSGKPWICFKSYRQDGRFVLKQVRVPTQEFLHACREDGRLKLQFVQPNDEILEDEEFEEEEDDDDDDDDDEEDDLEHGFIHDDTDEQG